MDHYLPAPAFSRPLYAEKAGIVSAMDTRALGMAVVALGGGRRQASDAIDYSVGLSNMIALGSRADTQRPLAVIHAASEAQWQEAAQAVRTAIVLSDQAPETTPVVYRRISE